MEHVIDVEDGDAAVLEEAGSGGLLARGLLADRPLAAYVGPAETPRYVVRNRKRGVSVERTDASDAGDSGGADAEGEIAPDGNHSAAALVTDVRVLFAVGRADGDRTRSVALSEVVDARTEDGLLGGALVLDTVDGLQYRFPTRGDLGAVRAFVDAAAAIWARAERHLEAAGDALDRADARFDSVAADGALDALDDARESLAVAREEAASLDGAAASLADRLDSSRARLRQYERRAHVERAERASDRARTRREDGDYEAAMDLLGRADESYAAALSVDADLPTDASIERRRDRLATERDRLSTAPLERARAAVEEASSAEDPAAAVERWERALDRYETLRTLDWGRDERRFAGERETVHDRLATVAERLVEARCERARRAIDLLGDAPPRAADAAAERATAALDAAHDVARERVPEAVDTVERLQDRLAEHRARTDEAVADDPGNSGDLTARETVVVPSGEEPVDGETADGETTDDETGDDAPADAEGDAPIGGESPGGDARDGERTRATGGARNGPGEAHSGERAPDGSEADRGAPDAEEWVFVDGEADDEWASAARTEAAAADAEESDGDASETNADDAETDVDVSSLGADGFRALVASLFEAAGWETESRAESLGAVDLRATTPEPVAVTAAVLTVDVASAAAVDPADLDRIAEAVDRGGDLDEAVVAAGGRLPEPTRREAADRGVRVVGPDALAALIDENDVSLPADDSIES